MSLLNDISEGILQEHREALGCENPTKVCWCEICKRIETIVYSTAKKIKENIQ